MDLSFLIPSKIRRDVLAYFVENPEAQVYVRELARELKISPQQVYRELLNLESWGLLFSSKRGNQRVFRVNQKFPFYPAITELFRCLDKENNRCLEVVNVLDWEKLSSQYQKIPTPPEIIPGLTTKRRRLRSYDEEKSLKKKGLL